MSLIAECWRCAGLRAGIRGRGEMSSRARSPVLPSAAGHPASDAAHLRPGPGRPRGAADGPQDDPTVARQAAAVHRHAVARQGPLPPSTTRQPLTSGRTDILPRSPRRPVPVANGDT